MAIKAVKLRKALLLTTLAQPWVAMLHLISCLSIMSYIVNATAFRTLKVDYNEDLLLFSCSKESCFGERNLAMLVTHDSENVHLSDEIKPRRMQMVILHERALRSPIWYVPRRLIIIRI